MFGASVRDLGFRVPSCGSIGVLRVWGFRVYGFGLGLRGLGFEASGSREVGDWKHRSSPFRTGRSAYRLPDRRNIDLRVYPMPKVNCLRSQKMCNLEHSEPENLLVSTST